MNNYKTCPDCDGLGHYEVVRKVPDPGFPPGELRYMEQCSHCHGWGDVWEYTCATCGDGDSELRELWGETICEGCSQLDTDEFQALPPVYIPPAVKATFAKYGGTK